MSRDQRGGAHDRLGGELGDDARGAVAPGKRTLTASLRSASGRATPSTAATAPDSAADAARAAQSALTDRWMDVAMRPDLHEAPAQRKLAPAASEPAAMVGPGAGRPLPEPVQAKMERSFGADFSAVRVHEGGHAAALGAAAYAQGTDLHFAPGQYDPDSERGQALIGHELTHVVQQAAGRVTGTAQAKGVTINDDGALEAEADDLGARAARGERVASVAGVAPPRGSTSEAAAVQAKFRGDLVKRCYIDEDTGDEYDSQGSWGDHQVLRRRTDHHEVKMSNADLEPIESASDKKIRLNQVAGAGMMVDAKSMGTPVAPKASAATAAATSATAAPSTAAAASSSAATAAQVSTQPSHTPPSVASLYKQMFATGDTFKGMSVAEAVKARAGEIAALRKLAATVEGLQQQARAGDANARAALPAHGKQLANDGAQLARELFGCVVEYGELLQLMDMFVTGELPTNPVYTGRLWQESSALVGHLRFLTKHGVTTWESQPGDQEAEVVPGVTVRQFAFLEMSGPSALMGPLVGLMAKTTAITCVVGQARTIPLKRFRARDQATLQAWMNGSPQVAAMAPNPPTKRGDRFCTDWSSVVPGNAKYVERAVAKVPRLGQVIGAHTYVVAFAKDPDQQLQLFDMVCALLPMAHKEMTRPAMNIPAGDATAADDDELDAEAEHQQSYSSSAASGNLADDQKKIG